MEGETAESIQKAAQQLTSALQQLYSHPGVIEEDTLSKLESAGKDIGHVLAQPEDEGLPVTPKSPHSKPPPPCPVQGPARPVNHEALNELMREFHDAAPSEITGGQCCCDPSDPTQDCSDK